MPTFIRDVLIRIFSMTYKERESKKIKGHINKKRAFIYNYRGTGSEFYKLRIEFRKEEVEKEEIIRILSKIIEELKKR